MAKQVLRLDAVAGSQLLDLIHACADGCDNVEAFRTLIRRQVSPLIPHRFSIAVLGTLSFDRITMHQRIGVDHPEAFMLSAPHQLNIRDRPAVAKWLASREPLVIDAPRDHHWLSALELREIEHHQMGRLAIHGRIDLSARMASYFSFAGVDPALRECDLRHRLELIAPHLHAAFTGVPCIDAEVRPAFGLTAIERELLHWLAAGHSNADIARARERSPATIRNQLHVLYGKLDVSGRAEAVAVASRLLG
jgi:DNA-binding CsgD family transcriptional regulator